MLEQKLADTTRESAAERDALLAECESLRARLTDAATNPPAVTADRNVQSALELEMEQREHQFQAQTQQLQRRISAVEEEKTIMLQHMREHIKQLARENYDLKRQSSALPNNAQTSPLEDGKTDSQVGERSEEASAA